MGARGIWQGSNDPPDFIILGNILIPSFGWFMIYLVYDVFYGHQWSLERLLLGCGVYVIYVAVLCGLQRSYRRSTFYGEDASPLLIDSEDEMERRTDMLLFRSSHPRALM